MLVVGSILQIITFYLFYFRNSFHTLNLISALTIMTCYIVMIPGCSLLSEVRFTSDKSII